MTRQPRHFQDPATRARLEADPWTARIVDLNWKRTQVHLALGRDLFSSGGVDFGTERLLQLLAKPTSPLRTDAPLRLLDVGCGAGTIAIAIAAAMENVTAVGCDRDMLAVRFARENVSLNGLQSRVTILDAGVGYEPAIAQRCEPFDVIVTNVPAKVGDNGLYELLFGAGPLLKKGGLLAVVYVTPLDETMAGMATYHQQEHGPFEKVAESRGSEHVAELRRFPAGLPEFESDDPLINFRREDAPETMLIAGVPAMPHYAVHDVAEFDTPSHWTPLLANLIDHAQAGPARDGGERVLVFDPDHGLIASLLAHRRRPKSIALLARDTLELAVAERNLRAALARWKLADDVEVERAPVQLAAPWLPAPGGDYGWIAGHLQWREGTKAHVATLEALKAALAPEGRIALACGTGQLENLKRAARSAGLRDGKDARKKGYAAVLLRARKESK